QRAVFADDVYQVADDRAGGFVILVVDIAPGILRARRIGLPEGLPNAGQLPALDIEHRRAFGVGGKLMVDRSAALIPIWPPGARGVVVVGGEARQGGRV